MHKQSSISEVEKIRRDSGGSVKRIAKEYTEKQKSKSFGHNYRSSEFIQNNPVFFNTYNSNE